ncbi:hypothetical protein [Paenibacillus illinoisensis]|uniref:hypothetical protein n=1 Tax=Paenibacillus illinoisensis TaxID=59845 RepID=UPI00301B7E5C
MNEKTFKFTGIPSGDYESFVWDVSKEQFVTITGKEPVAIDEAVFTDGRYMIYPNDLLKGIADEDKTDYEFEITIRAKKIRVYKKIFCNDCEIEEVVDQYKPDSCPFCESRNVRVEGRESTPKEDTKDA